MKRTITVLVACAAIACVSRPPGHGKEGGRGVELDLMDTSGAEPRRIEAVELGDSLSLGLRGLEAGAGVEVFLHDDLDQEWSYARLFADREGRVPPSLFWYQSGVIGRTSRAIAFRPEPAFETFEEADAFFARHELRLTVRALDGRELARRRLPVRPRTRPLLYPSDADGVLRNALDVRSEDLWVTGRGFPAGSTVQLFVVDNQHGWALGDPLADRTDEVETVRLAPGETGFTTRVWRHADARTGAFDLVARIGERPRDLVLRPQDVLSWGEDTGVLYFIIVNGNVVIDSAGRTRGAPAKFEFSDSFEKLEDVWAAVDPTDVPPAHTGGSYAKYWVVDDQPDTYWDAPAPGLVDVSGGAEIHRVKYWCINATRRLVWPGATQVGPIAGYELVVDFGAVPAADSASFTDDSTYDKGTDFIDGYQDVGFWVFEDPGSPGPLAVGSVELDEMNGISGITDPMGLTGPTENVTLAWASFKYPATMAGTGTPVSPSQASYPVALFMHGRHFACDSNGAANGGAGSYQPFCADANRVPSHEGYDYILERLASQGIFTLSISTHEIQRDLGAWDYDARGRLVLKFLDLLRDWNDNGTDPFGGIFAGKLDLSRVALSGHSRGGEGVVAAEEINHSWPAPHSILAVNAIAPTDQTYLGPAFVATDAAYFLLTGARDGDVSNHQGLRTYDRLYPQGATPRQPKTTCWVFEANHNYFNTVWTDAAALGVPNGWAGAGDEGAWIGLPALAAADQRQVALTTIAAFFRRHLQGIEPYKEILTGRLRPSALPNDKLFWTHQEAARVAVDDFEESLPADQDSTTNAVSGAVNTAGFSSVLERLLSHDNSEYPPGFTADSSYYHDTLGLKLAWAGAGTYETDLPVGSRDVSAYTHLTLRAGKKADGTATGPALNLLVNVVDGLGNSALWDLRTDQFDVVPHPFRSSQSILTGVRIPLRNFTQNNSMVDLTDLRKVIIKTTGTGEIGLDDIEFGE